MAAALLSNSCITKNDPCKPRWRLHVEHLELINHGALQLEMSDSKRLEK